MKKNMVVVVVGLAIIICAGFFLQKQTEKMTSLTIQLENQYQRSFLELSSAMDGINAQLAQLLVTTSSEQTLLGLSSLWREVYAAINQLSSLPVAMHELENTDYLLNDVAEYSYHLIKKTVLQQQQLQQKDWAQLEEFYKRSRVVKQELSDIQAKILNEDLRFSEIETTSLVENENQIVAAFRSIETQVTAFPELKFEEGVRKIEPEPRPISGEQISQVEAIEIADRFVKQVGIQNREATVEFISQGGIIPVYGIAYYGQADQEPVYVEVSQKGGLILQMYQYQPVKEARYDQQQCMDRAQTFLKELAFPTMALVESKVDDRIVDLTFVPIQEGVLLYSDMVKIQVSRQDNTILNYDQTSYATRHYNRHIPSAKLSEQEIRVDMNPNFEIADIRLALIPDEYSINEILTYEVRGRVVEEEFSIFVDANSGAENRIVRLTEEKSYLFRTSDRNV